MALTGTEIWIEGDAATFFDTTKFYNSIIGRWIQHCMEQIRQPLLFNCFSPHHAQSC